MYRIIISIFFLGSLFIGCVDKPDIEWDIRQIMNQQAQAWSNKDLEGFMEPYWHSDSMRFMGSKGVTLGWKATLERYQKNYTKDKMGKLIFNDLHFEILSPEAAWVDGQWTLLLPDRNAVGRFSLLWKRMDGKWQIVADHSS